MDLLKIYAEVIKSPASSKPYKDLVAYYSENKKFNEVQAFSRLIEKKFTKNDDNTNTDPR